MYNKDVIIKGTIDDASLNNYWLTVTKDVVEDLSSKVGVPRNGTAREINFSLDLEGKYIIKLEARDKAGNKDGTATIDGKSAKTIRFEIDKTAPEIAITSKGPFTVARPTISGTVDNDAEKYRR